MKKTRKIQPPLWVRMFAHTANWPYDHHDLRIKLHREYLKRYRLGSHGPAEARRYANREGVVLAWSTWVRVIDWIKPF